MTTSHLTVDKILFETDLCYRVRLGGFSFWIKKSHSKIILQNTLEVTFELPRYQIAMIEVLIQDGAVCN